VPWPSGGPKRGKPKKYRCHIQVWNGKRYKKCNYPYYTIEQFERHMKRHGGKGRER
jgi:hypothetical protein